MKLSLAALAIISGVVSIPAVAVAINYLSAPCASACPYGG